ncbi:replicative DNA helicase [Hippea jasoniae]|uniref:replicative DNA helicase n=1 Tax=Hippea jasoniae TaxID=944479 RepID=UPI000691CCD8|nr:replicative DNA helicase [Hippea jasoniae]
MKSSGIRAYPQAIEAERALLCSLFLDNSKISECMEIIDENDFFDEKNGEIFSILKQLYAEGIPFDFVTVSNAIKEKGLSDKISPAYLTGLIEFLPAPANIIHYATIIKKKSTLRQLISMSTEVASICYDEPEDLEEVFNIAEKRLFEIVSNRSTRYRTSEDLVEETLDYLAKLKNRKSVITGVASGYPDLDRFTNGFQEGDLIIVAGRPGMGKTAFALNIAVNAALDHNKNIGIFSLEMSARQLVLRMISTLSKVDMYNLRTGFLTDAEWAAVVKAIDKLKKAKIFIDDTSLLTSIDIRTKARKLKMEQNIDMLIIDYLQLVEGKNSSVNRTQQISEISRSLKILAKELNIPVMALSQLNRAVETREDKRPTPADLRESGSIEQDADVIMFIYRDEVYRREKAEKGVAEIIIAKQRNGPQGTVKLQFDGKTTSFRSLAKDADTQNIYNAKEEIEFSEKEEFAEDEEYDSF